MDSPAAASSGSSSTTVRSRSAEAKSSTDCVASSIAALCLRQVLSAFCDVGTEAGVLDEAPGFIQHP